MNREECLDWLCRLRSEIYVYMPKEWIIPMNNALDMVIKELEQKPCEDAISRSDAIRVASGYCHWSNIPKELEKLPSVSTEKVGCWVEIDDEPHEVWECDHCGFVIDGSGCVDPYEYRDIYKYCPNCGCFMKGDNDERS